MYKKPFQLLLLIIFIYLLSKFLTIFQIIKTGETNLLPFYIGMTCFLFGLCYGIYVFVYTLFKFKNSVTFGKSHLTIKDTATNKKTEIHFDFIDNLLLEKYIYRTVFTALIITTKSGTKYRILNFFVWNFKDLRQELALLKKRKTGSEFERLKYEN